AVRMGEDGCATEFPTENKKISRVAAEKKASPVCNSRTTQTDTDNAGDLTQLPNNYTAIFFDQQKNK
ncbi:hypothetical protein ABTA42_19915, partial [Acinetobacter baumannii]